MAALSCSSHISRSSLLSVELDLVLLVSVVSLTESGCKYMSAVVTGGSDESTSSRSWEIINLMRLFRLDRLQVLRFGFIGRIVTSLKG